MDSNVKNTETNNTLGNEHPPVFGGLIAYLSKRDRRPVIYLAASLMLLTTVPYFLAYAMQGTAWQFSGFLFGVEDGNSYIAKMLSGTYGSWLFRTPYTTYPQKGVLAFLPYLVLGKLAAPPQVHIQLVILFHAYRLAAGFLAILATYDFLNIFLQKNCSKWLALGLSVAGGGVGWVLLILGKEQWLGSLPLAFYSPESFGFLSLLGIPHLALARAALLWTVVHYFKAMDWRRREWLPHAIKAGLWWLILVLAQPITSVVLGLLLGLHSVVAGWVERKNVRNSPGEALRSVAGVAKRLLVLGSLPAPLIVYTAAMFQSDPFLQAWTSQNIIRSPHPLHYVIAYGLCIPFAVPGGRKLVRKYPVKGWLPVLWVLLLPVLAYAPVNVQRRLPDGVWVVIVLLAIAGWEGIRANRLNRLALWGWFGFALPSSLILFGGMLATAVNPKEPVFLPEDAVSIFSVLEKEAAPGAVVLAPYAMSNAAPAWAPVKVIVGHGPESIRGEDASVEIAGFYSGALSQREMESFLARYGVRYVIWDPLVNGNASFLPARPANLVLLSQAGEFRLYGVGGAGAEQP